MLHLDGRGLCQANMHVSKEQVYLIDNKNNFKLIVRRSRLISCVNLSNCKRPVATCVQNVVEWMNSVAENRNTKNKTQNYFGKLCAVTFHILTDFYCICLPSLFVSTKIRR